MPNATQTKTAAGVADGAAGGASETAPATTGTTQPVDLSEAQVQQILAEHKRQLEEAFAQEKQSLLTKHGKELTDAKVKIAQYEVDLGLTSDEEKATYRDSQFWREQTVQTLVDQHGLSDEDRLELLEHKDYARMKRNLDRMLAAKKTGSNATGATGGADTTVKALLDRLSNRTTSPGGGGAGTGRTADEIRDNYIKNPNAQTRKDYEAIRAN